MSKEGWGIAFLTTTIICCVICFVLNLGLLVGSVKAYKGDFDTYITEYERIVKDAGGGEDINKAKEAIQAMKKVIKMVTIGAMVLSIKGILAQIAGFLGGIIQNRCLLGMYASFQIFTALLLGFLVGFSAFVAVDCRNDLIARENKVSQLSVGTLLLVSCAKLGGGKCDVSTIDKCGKRASPDVDMDKACTAMEDVLTNIHRDFKCCGFTGYKDWWGDGNKGPLITYKIDVDFLGFKFKKEIPIRIPAQWILTCPTITNLKAENKQPGERACELDNSIQNSDKMACLTPESCCKKPKEGCSGTKTKFKELFKAKDSKKKFECSGGKANDEKNAKDFLDSVLFPRKLMKDQYENVVQPLQKNDLSMIHTKGCVESIVSRVAYYATIVSCVSAAILFLCIVGAITGLLISRAVGKTEEEGFMVLPESIVSTMRKKARSQSKSKNEGPDEKVAG